MLPELGNFALVLALLLALAQAVFGIAGPALGRQRWMAAAKPAALGQAALTLLALAALIDAFVEHDFSVRYVADNSNTALPLLYRVAAVWGAHEGSMLLWTVILGGWTVAVALRSNALPHSFVARVLGVLGLISAGFLLFLLATSNPFERLSPAWPDGRDLNPLLQDPALAAHPPMLYLGYVGFSVAFAFACAAMLEGRLDQAWARWTRPWTTVAWAFLSVGIALGSWWAYYELGWGGYWFWDPVENASFMPWLMGTALIHSLSVTDKRGLFKSWTLLLAILTFSLSLLGTFLVRSGVLVSVHSFAADPGRGVFILAFLVIAIGGALALYAWRAPLLKSTAGFELTSRESFLLFNNILLVIACTSIFAGTLAPLISDALGLGTLSVGAQYFNPVFMLPMLPLVALVSVGIHAGWKKGRLGERRRAVLGALAFATALTLAFVLGLGMEGQWLAPLGLALGLWIIISSLVEPAMRIRRGLSLSRAVLGMALAHIGLGVFVVSITAVETYTQERDISLEVGGQASIGPYEYQLVSLGPVEGPNYEGVRAEIIVSQSGRELTRLYPEKRQYWVQRSVMTEAGIESDAVRNIFAALGEDLGGGKWSVRAQIRPLVNYVWLAAVLMALGGVLAASDRRYRVREAATVPAGAATQSS
jgi:cytochrome c-type biogenesis protein CcmF